MPGRMVKSGLKDRDELHPKFWYEKRVALVGDAAYPSILLALRIYMTLPAYTPK